MKTVRQIAVELNISPKTVYKKINTTMKDELKDHIKKKQGQTWIDEQ